MLSDKDREWLEKREQIKIANGLYFCAHCDMYSGDYSVFTGYCTAFEIDDCPMVSNFRDAAEFEARVAAKLATMTCDRFCPYALNNRMCRRRWADSRPMYACRPKHARLAVEEEMEHGSAL